VRDCAEQEIFLILRGVQDPTGRNFSRTDLATSLFSMGGSGQLFSKAASYCKLFIKILQ
jgi:hypothetical protein